ncbi:hypothetical protein LJC59_07475 [Desulfovibrio sp. OttesenSCG-928-A18]|nr:hypothetical protein [Desulfovibrio sp. OttesenSCG-928-A18]
MRILPAIMACLFLLFATGCSDEQKIDSVKKTTLNKCGGKTVEGLVSGILQSPQWSISTDKYGVTVVSVKGTLIGEQLPAWVREQKIMDITFRFKLERESGKFNPGELDGFPSLTEPEGVLQAYKALACS